MRQRIDTIPFWQYRSECRLSDRQELLHHEQCEHRCQPRKPEGSIYIGPGAVLFGEITIADGCYIGANAVVNKSFTEPNSVIVGIPAKVIKTDPVHWWVKNGLNRD